KMVVWGFDISDRHLRFRRFCIKIILTGIQKSEITDCDTGGCGMWDKKTVRYPYLCSLVEGGFYFSHFVKMICLSVVALTASTTPSLLAQVNG
ncbi:hypothetical protein PN450_08045, partial [Dolichospermum lemmermannii CS-548]|nr:hypothetical protein [Dolichospermum lemmermannii CS-548]